MLKDLEERINMLKYLDNMYKQLGNLNRYENYERQSNDNKIKKHNFKCVKFLSHNYQCT